MMTAYKNNIWMHYPQYVKKWLYCTFLQRAQKPKGDKVLKRYAARITYHALYGSALPEEPMQLPCDEAFLEDLLQKMIPSIPTHGEDDVAKNRLYDLKVRPWVYLQRMVWINRRLEEDAPLEMNPKIRRLYQPLALISTLIPSHIRLDTSGLTQLLMDKERLDHFKTFYEDTFGCTLNIKGKADMLSSYTKITGQKNPTEFEQALFATRYWRFLCRFTNYRSILKTIRSDKSIWVFDNMVLTDGYSISFQITPIENFKKKGVQHLPPKKTEEETPSTKKEKTAEFLSLSDGTGQQWWSSIETPNRFEVLSGDPGKNDILALTNGVKDIRYTKAQRDQDTCKAKRTATTLQFRKKETLKGTFLRRGSEEPVVNPTVHDYESKVMSESTKKSCVFENFVDYWGKRRLLVDKTITYDKAYFRQAKFMVYSLTKASEAKFFNQVEKHFEVPRERIVVAYGDWGKNPNLAGNAPTPGIGFRRNFEQHGFKTVTTPENDTSQTCPCCKLKSLKKETIGRDPVEKHHLLRCKNENCASRWWNRNIAGSLNILQRFYERVGMPFPNFIGKRTKCIEGNKSSTSSGRDNPSNPIRLSISREWFT
jgi:hypothetical protein